MYILEDDLVSSYDLYDREHESPHTKLGWSWDAAVLIWAARVLAGFCWCKSRTSYSSRISMKVLTKLL